jgi:integrase
LPPRGQARQRWLTRDEVARLLSACWRNREVQEGKSTDKRPLRHLARFILLGVYTGDRPGAILNSSWRQGDGVWFADTVNGVFHRHAEGEAETTKRQPTVKLSPRLLGHLRRWKRLDAGNGYVVNYRGHKVLSVKTALHTACRIGIRAAPHGGVMARCTRPADPEGRGFHRHGEQMMPQTPRQSSRGGNGLPIGRQAACAC